MKKIRQLFDATMLRFLLVGAANTLVGSAVMFGLYNLLHCSYRFSTVMNYVVGSIVSFFLNKYFTFQNRERSLGQILRFVLNIVVCYLIAYGAAKPLAARLLSSASQTVQENVAMLVGLGLFTVLNYFGQRFFAFRKGRS